MQIGRKIYYDIFTGKILAELSERSGDVRETTQEEDFASYIGLQGRTVESVRVLQLDYGQYVEQFRKNYGYKINIFTNKIVFNLTPPQSPLEQAKQIKKNEMIQSRIKVLHSGFDCQPFGDGVTHHYIYDDLARDRFKSYFMVQNSPLAQETVRWSTNLEPMKIHTAQQFLMVCGAALQHESEIEYRDVLLNNLINKATSIEELEGIIWDMEL